MKKLLLIILVPFLVFAQQYSYPVELYFITEYAPPTPIITCTLTAQAQCWGDLSGNTCVEGHGEYFLTDDYDDITYVPSGNNLGDNSAGFDFITAQNGYPTFAYGIYKVTNNVSSKYFYLDYRDYRVGYYNCYDPPPYGHRIDVWLKYDYSNDIFSYKSGNPDNMYHNIANGQLLNIWDIKRKGQQLTSLFPSYWDNCLAVINNGSNYPKCVWGSHPDDQQTIDVTGYNIYRAVTNQNPPPNPNFILIATVSDTTFEYTDNQYGLGGPILLHYKVTAIYEYQARNRVFETTPTNTVIVGGSIFKQSEGIKKEIDDFALYQNYPNPFNPTTKISFVVGENSFITLKIFDILGNEVANLFNGEKKPGYYIIDFDASNLTSGLYFYKLFAVPLDKSKKVGLNSYSFTKKMILLK